MSAEGLQAIICFELHVVLWLFVDYTCAVLRTSSTEGQSETHVRSRGLQFTEKSLSLRVTLSRSSLKQLSRFDPVLRHDQTARITTA